MENEKLITKKECEALMKSKLEGLKIKEKVNYDTFVEKEVGYNQAVAEINQKIEALKSKDL